MEKASLSLKKQGWNVSLDKIKEGFLKDEENGTDEEKMFLKDPERWILNQNIKCVTSPCLPDGITTGKVSQLSTPLVLQIKKIELISAPTYNQESEVAPRMLKLTLTDGKFSCFAIEFESLPKISLKTPPGTKVCLVGTVRLSSGIILLDSKNIQILGGEVPELIEEWKIQQLLLNHVRATDKDGPPPWVPFGHKIPQLNIDSKKDEKSLQEEEKVVRDEEFLSQRKDAIAAVASASGVHKVIKGSGRQMEIQQPERRGRGRGRRERTPREDMQSSRPRDSIRLFEFLEPRIGAEEEEVEEEIPEDEAVMEGANQQSWERDGIYRPRRESDREDSYQERRGSSRGRRGSYQDRSDYREPRGSSHQRSREGSWRDDRPPQHRDRRESHRGRGGYREDSHQDAPRRGDYRGREGGGGRGNDRRGSSRGNRGYRDIEDSHIDRQQFSRSGGRRDDAGYSRNIYSSRYSPEEKLVNDFAAWPGLNETKDSIPSASASRSQTEVSVAPSKPQEQWAIDDYCLAKWENTDNFYPAIVQQLLPQRKSVTVMFVETGAIRIVETKQLRRDPQDVGSSGQQGNTNSRRGQSQSTRIYTPRNRGRY